eukprot:7474325-Pyramimonas_sp.AAC.1
MLSKQPTRTSTRYRTDSRGSPRGPWKAIFDRFPSVLDFGVLACPASQRSLTASEAFQIAPRRPTRPRRGSQDGPGRSPNSPSVPQERAKRRP